MDVSEEMYTVKVLRLDYMRDIDFLTSSSSERGSVERKDN